MAYQAKKTNYRGIWFKSNLEAKTAEAFDRLGVRWEYESRCFRDCRYSGGQYTPDFWLPDNHTYVEVVGRPDERHLQNAIVFCSTQHAFCPSEDDFGNDALLSDDTPGFVFVIGDGWVTTPQQRLCPSDTHDHNTLYVTFCKRCNRYSFAHRLGSYGCRHCGHSDGDHAIVGENLFKLAGIHA